MSASLIDQRVTAVPGVLFRILGDESVLLNLKNETYLGLDPVGTRMWSVLTSAPSVHAAYQLLLEEFDVAPEQLRRDLEEFIASLAENELVVLSSPAPAEVK